MSATNIFVVVADAPRSGCERELDTLVRRTIDVDKELLNLRKGSIRLRIHDDGQFTSTSGASARLLERQVSVAMGMPIARQSASVEVWVVRRRGLQTILGIKLGRPGRKPTRGGVLGPEICAALASVEPLRDRDVLDPFAGSGAIGVACLAAGARTVWLNDVDKEPRRNGGLATSRAKWTHVDFRKLPVPTAAISVVVTDPPWGDYVAVEGGVAAFYEDLGSAVKRWLEPGGAIVALLPEEPLAMNSLIRRSEVTVEMNSPVLINGHKARVVVGRYEPCRSKVDQ
jgi:16S rRNA G966 N2-methylase RsmD